MKKYTAFIKLSQWLCDCPPAWINFINEINPRGRKLIDENIKLYNGQFVKSSKINNGNGIVKFKTESDRILFLLRWS